MKMLIAVGEDKIIVMVCMTARGGHIMGSLKPPPPASSLAGHRRHHTAAHITQPALQNDFALLHSPQKISRNGGKSEEDISS